MKKGGFLIGTTLLSTGTLAKLSGLSIRTLQYYDTIGLVKPAERNHSGYRRYTLNDLWRLQQVVALKYIGFSLGEIQRMLTTPDYDLAGALKAQRKTVAEKAASRLNSIITALDKALAALEGGKAGSEQAVNIIRTMHMETNNEMLKKYYSEKALAKLSERARTYTPEQAQADAAKWAEIGRETKRLAYAGADPAGKEALALAKRSQDLIDQFTGSDPEIAEGLGKLYADRKQFPAYYGEHDEKVDKFTQAMMAAYKAKKAKKTTK